MKIDIEIVVEDAQGARLAAREGAQSIELCAKLDQGGLTPDKNTLKEAIQAAKDENPNIKFHVLILNRPDGFYVGPDDVKALVRDIHMAKELGADGVVFGALEIDNNIALSAVAELCRAAQPMMTTFHRAFDRIPDQFQAMDQLAAMGVSRILTSGRPGKAPDHAAHLTELVQWAGNRIQIVVGGGVRSENVTQLAQETRAKTLHMSCRAADPDANGLKPTSPEGLKRIMALRKKLSFS